MSDEAARPVALDPDAAGDAREGDDPTVSVEGNPSARERAVLAAVVGAVRDEYLAAGGAETAPDTPDAEGVAAGDADASAPGGEGGDARARIAFERRCPICGEGYHSRRPVDGPTQVGTPAAGDATVCFDRVGERLYVHRSR